MYRKQTGRFVGLHLIFLAPDFWRSQAKRALQKKRDQPRIENRAKNVVMFVGSGLGVASITAARILKGQIEGHSGEESMLAIDNFPYSGFSKVKLFPYYHDSLISIKERYLFYL